MKKQLYIKYRSYVNKKLHKKLKKSISEEFKTSTEKDIDTRLMKAWTAIDKLSVIWKSDMTDKMKRSFFQAAVVSMLLYGSTYLLFFFSFALELLRQSSSKLIALTKGLLAA